MEWRGYLALGRSQPPNVSGLSRHAEPAMVMLRHAATGFPSQPNLRDALIHLQTEYSIMPNVEPQRVWTEAVQASHNWRAILKDVYELKKKGTVVNDQKVQALIDAIALPTPAPAPPAEAVAIPHELASREGEGGQGRGR